MHDTHGEYEMVEIKDGDAFSEAMERARRQRQWGGVRRWGTADRLAQHDTHANKRSAHVDD